jgi:AraC family transcriptional regulator
MNNLSVRIVDLSPIRVASAHGFGKEPEGIAIHKLLSWAKRRGFLEQPQAHRFFGFNNPNPQAGSPNYGYELWMTVGPEVKSEEAPEGTITVKDFAGGLYAVTRVKGVENIAPTWQRLVAWGEGSPYSLARHQWLEEHFYSDFASETTDFIDLYMPIRKPLD